LGRGTGGEGKLAREVNEELERLRRIAALTAH
jgi:hypothetical protein